jgi:hypothetical protein
MAARLNNLKVRRIDLLEQLEERYAVMTKEKEKYEALLVKFREECDKHDELVEQWKEDIKQYLLKRWKDATPEIDYHGRDAYARSWNRMARWTASLDITYTVDELEKIVGPMPEQPEGPEMPSFLRDKWGRGYTMSPSLYQSVYQAIQVLHLSDDEHVPASMYQMALEVL